MIQGNWQDSLSFLSSVPFFFLIFLIFLVLFLFHSEGYQPSTVLDEHGSGPLHWAAAKGHTDIAVVLLDSGFPSSLQYFDFSLPLDSLLSFFLSSSSLPFFLILVIFIFLSFEFNSFHLDSLSSFSPLSEMARATLPFTGPHFLETLALLRLF